MSLKNKEVKLENYNKLTKENKEMTKKIDNLNDKKNNDKEQEKAAENEDQEILVFDGVVVKKDGNLVTVGENETKTKKVFVVDPETPITEIEMKNIPNSSDYEKKEKGEIDLSGLKEMDNVSVFYKESSKTAEGNYKPESIKKFVVIE